MRVIEFRLIENDKSALMINGVASDLRFSSRQCTHVAVAMDAVRAEERAKTQAEATSLRGELAATIARVDTLRSMVDDRNAQIAQLKAADAAPRKPTFEYLALSPDSDEKEMDARGREGWELVAANDHGLYLKRVLA